MSEELARRAVACKRWRWMPGAVDRHGRRVLALEVDDEGEKWLHYASQTGGGWLSLDMWPRGVGGVEAVPDFADPATLGCLLALVREAWGDPLMHAEPEPRDSEWWRVWTRTRPMRMVGEGATEAEALVAALEAAP